MTMSTTEEPGKGEAPTFPPGPKERREEEGFSYGYGVSDETSPVRAAPEGFCLPVTLI